jgi:hypothetical protein
VIEVLVNICIGASDGISGLCHRSGEFFIPWEISSSKSFKGLDGLLFVRNPIVAKVFLSPGSRKEGVCKVN